MQVEADTSHFNQQITGDITGNKPGLVSALEAIGLEAVVLVRLKVSPSAAAVALGFPHGRVKNKISKIRATTKFRPSEVRG